MTSLKNNITIGIVGLAWALTIVLVTQLLSGTFDTRSCTTACVQSIFVGAIATNILGLVLSGIQLKQSPNLASKWCFWACAALLAIFLTTMIVGTFF